jgi:RNA polymerase sigma-70 factor (ECF subfamily)
MSQQTSLATATDFEAYISENKGLLYKIAGAYCKDPDDRKDLVQEIIIQLWQAFGRFNHSVKLSTYTYRIALNVAISFYRKDVRRRENTTGFSESLVEIFADEETDESEQQISHLQHFISELKEVERAIMLLYLEDRSQKEIGEILGISPTNVSTRVGRIKEKLRIKFSLINE